MTTKEILSSGESRMNKAVDAFKRDLATLRSGRASPALVEHLPVDYYGVPTPLNQLASISAPEARLLVIQPWDRRAVPLIEKSILRSDLGLNPANDGAVIRLPIPALSEERRRELVKVVHKRSEEGKIAIRNIRRDTIAELRELEKNKEISQDENKRHQELIQKLTDSFILQIDKLGAAKEAELMEV